LRPWVLSRLALGLALSAFGKDNADNFEKVSQRSRVQKGQPRRSSIPNATALSTQVFETSLRKRDNGYGNSFALNTPDRTVLGRTVLAKKGGSTTPHQFLESRLRRALALVRG
jgi:hypothetical protein